MCVYGAATADARDQLFGELATKPAPPGVTVLGGDFNCTQDVELDRSLTTQKTYDSAALAHLLQQWDLLDATTADALETKSAADIADFHAKHHTFFYGHAQGEAASCRLDRWYVSRTDFHRVLDVDAEKPSNSSDHQAVFLQLSHTTPQRTQKTIRQVLRYPLPECTRAGVQEVVAHLIGVAAERLRGLPPEDSARDWDAFKTTVRKACLVEQRRRTKMVMAAYRRRVFRLRLSLRNAIAGPASTRAKV